MNPDKNVRYGFRGISDSCAAQLPAELGPATYTGIVDSHPYAVAVERDGTSFVADAAGNDIVAVDPRGSIRTVAVLPPSPTKVTAEAAGALGMRLHRRSDLLVRAGSD